MQRIKADLVYLYKIKINIQYSRVNCKKYFFMNRVIHMGNNLDSDIVNCDSIFKFKCELNNIENKY